jgi:hypothetical protein
MGHELHFRGKASSWTNLWKKRLVGTSGLVGCGLVGYEVDLWDRDSTCGNSCGKIVDFGIRDSTCATLQYLFYVICVEQVLTNSVHNYAVCTIIIVPSGSLIFSDASKCYRNIATTSRA